MSESFTLQGPEQTRMWVLLSRRHQLQMHLKGLETGNALLKVPGIVKWCKNNVPGCEHARTAKDCVVPLEYFISQSGGEVSYKVVNLHCMRKASPDAEFFVDAGILSSPEEITDPGFLNAYAEGLVELVLTLEEPRNPNGKTYVAA